MVVTLANPAQGDAAFKALQGPAQDEDAEFTDDALEAMYAATGGYPYFIQAYGATVWDLAPGSPITAEDVAYGIKRSFAVDELPGGPTYQMDYLKDGDKYKGPYQDGEDFAGVEVVDEKTIEIHLRNEWPTLPYFASFTQMSPIPKDKDTKEEYGNKPIATGPYKFKEYLARARDAGTRDDGCDFRATQHDRRFSTHGGELWRA